MAGFNLIALLSLAAFVPAALAMPWGPPHWGPWHWGRPHHHKPTWGYPVPAAKWTYPTSIPSTYRTGGPTITATGTATGSGAAAPTGYWADKREIEELTQEKREAFHGPRQHGYPHHWPHPSPCDGETTSLGYPTATGTGIGIGTGTGVYHIATGYPGLARH